MFNLDLFGKHWEKIGEPLIIPCKSSLTKVQFEWNSKTKKIRGYTITFITNVRLHDISFEGKVDQPEIFLKKIKR